MLQEYVGTPEGEYTVGVLHTLDGNFVGSIALRREIMGGLSNRIKAPNRTDRADLGPVLAVSSGVSQGVIDDFPEVRRQCEAIASAIGSRGPLNLQGRFANGVFMLFEINPRFSGTTYLRALAGYNEPDMLMRHHLRGETIAQPVPFAAGQIVRGLIERRVADFAPVAAWNSTANRGAL
jgi:carbamoyl-phosphate synthase large subunit